MDKKVCKHLFCKQKNNNTQCIKKKFSRIKKQPQGIGRDTADLNDMLINRSTYLNNFNKQKKISVSDADYIFQNRNQIGKDDNKDKRNIFKSEIVYDHGNQKGKQKNLAKSQNFYKDDNRMFVYYQKPTDNLKSFVVEDKDSGQLKYLVFKQKKNQAKKLIQFFQQFLQRHIIENQILKSQYVNIDESNDQPEGDFVSIKGIKIPSQKQKAKEDKVDYFDLQVSNNLNEQDALQENQKFKNTVTNLNEEILKAKLSLKKTQNQKAEEELKLNDISEFDDKSYFENLGQDVPMDYSAFDQSKRSSVLSSGLQNLDLQSYLSKQKENEEGKQKRQRQLNARRGSRSSIINLDLSQKNEIKEEPRSSKRFSFIQNIQQGFQRNKRLSDSGIVFEQPMKMQIQNEEPVDELDEILQNKKILTEEEEEFFKEFAPKKIDSQFQKELNKSTEDLFSPKKYDNADKFSDDEEDYFHKEHTNNLFHETLDEHNYRVSHGQREIQIDFDDIQKKRKLSLSGDENGVSNEYDNKNNNKQKESGFIQSKRFTLGKLDDAITQIRRESLKSQSQITKQTVADEFIENVFDTSIQQLLQNKQKQLTQEKQNLDHAQQSILLSKLDENYSQVLINTAKKNSMKLIKNLILEKQNQNIAYNIMQQDMQQRASLKVNSQSKENVQQNSINKVLQSDLLKQQVIQGKEVGLQGQTLKEVNEKIQKETYTSDSDSSSNESEDDIINREKQQSINDMINEKLQQQFEENRKCSILAKKSLAELYSNEMNNLIEEEKKEDERKEKKKRMSMFINEEYNIIQNSVRDILNEENFQKERRFSELINENLENARQTVLVQIDEEEQVKLDELVNDNLKLVRTSVHQLIHQEIQDQKKAKELDEAIDEKMNDIIEDEIQRQISNSVHQELEKQYQEKRRLSSCAQQRLSDIYDNEVENYFEDIQKEEELEEFINQNLAIAKTSVLEVIYEEEEDQKIQDMIEDNLNLVRLSVQEIIDKEVKNEKKKKRLSKMVQNDLNQMYLKEVQKKVNTEIVKSMYEQDIQLRKSQAEKPLQNLQQQKTEIKNEDQVKEQTRKSLTQAAEKIKQILNLEISDNNENRRLSVMVDDNLEQLKKFSIKQVKKEEKERRRLSTMVSQNLDNIVNREIQKSINTQIQLDMLRQAEEERRNSIIAKKTLNEIVNKEIQKQINQEIINSMTQKELEDYEMEDLVNNNLESLKDIQIRKTIDEVKLKQKIEQQIDQTDIKPKDKRRLSLMVDENFEEMVKVGIRHTLTKQQNPLVEVKEMKADKRQTDYQTQKNSIASSTVNESQKESIKNKKKQLNKKRSSFMKKDFQYEIIEDRIKQIPKQISEENIEPTYRRKTTIPEDKFVAKQTYTEINNDNIPMTRPKMNSIVMHKKSTLVKPNLQAEQRASIRPKMNSIVMHKKSVNTNFKVDENEAFVRPKLNSIVMHQKQKAYRPSIANEERVRPKMNSIVIHKKSVINQPLYEEEEAFVRPKLNSIVMHQRPTLTRKTITQETNMVRPKMNSIVIHKRSTVVKRPLVEEEESFVRPKLNSIVMHQRPTLTRKTISKDIEMVRPKMNSIVMHKKSTVSKQESKENEKCQITKLNSINLPKKSVLSNNSEDWERIRNDSYNISNKKTLRNMTNYNIQPIEEEDQDFEFVNQKLCQKNLRKITNKLLKEQKIEMKNAMVNHILDQPRKSTKHKRQSVQFDQFLKRNSKFNNIRFSVNPLFKEDKIIKEEKSQQQDVKEESKKDSSVEGNLQFQIMSINNIQKLIDKSIDKVNEEINQNQNNQKKGVQLVTVDTLDNLDDQNQQVVNQKQNSFQSHEPPLYDPEQAPLPHKQTINIRESCFKDGEVDIENDDNSISWMNKNSQKGPKNSLSTSSNRRMSTQVQNKTLADYDIQSAQIEIINNEPVMRKTTFDKRNISKQNHLTSQNSIGDLNDQNEEINELIPKKLTKQNSKNNIFKKTSKQFENYSFHSVVFHEEHSPELGTNAFKSQLMQNKKNLFKKRNTIDNYNKWKKYIQEYNIRMMEKMNRAFDKNQDPKQSTIILDEIMDQKIDYDYLIFCLKITPDQINKIKKIQRYFRNKLNKKIMERIKEGQEIFQRETNLIHIRKTNLF